MDEESAVGCMLLLLLLAIAFYGGITYFRAVGH